MNRLSLIIISCIALGVVLSGEMLMGQTVWTGPDVLVSQPASAPQSVVDVMIPGVASLTRGMDGFLCNTLAGDTCAAFQSIPTDFQFAFSNQNGNGTIAYGSAASHASFTFANFQTALGTAPGLFLPNAGNPSRPVLPGIGRHVPSNTYFDFELQYWGLGINGVPPEPGAFTYRRSSVPEPGSLALCSLFVCCVAGVRRR